MKNAPPPSPPLRFGAPLRLTPVVQHYAWGKRGKRSLVGRLAAELEPVDESMPYAELWVGAHNKAPSRTANGASLRDLLHEAPEPLLGKKLQTLHGAELPFLLKCLSVDEPLSIQAHPEKSLARELHQRDPENYPDENHKPEMAIALTEVVMLYGFKSPEELWEVFDRFPEAGALVGVENVRALSESEGGDAALRRAYERLALADDAELAKATASVLARIKARKRRSEEEDGVVEFCERYGARDRGVLSSLFMNRVRIQPREALFTPPGVLHAYLDGDLVECMSSSDNVVRGGLTPKYTDRPTLVRMARYDVTRPLMVQPVELAPGLFRYAPEGADFQVDRVTGRASREEPGPALVLCVTGRCVVESAGSTIGLTPGKALLVPAELERYELRVDEGESYRVTSPEAW